MLYSMLITYTSDALVSYVAFDVLGFDYAFRDVSLAAHAQEDFVALVFRYIEDLFPFDLHDLGRVDHAHGVKLCHFVTLGSVMLSLISFICSCVCCKSFVEVSLLWYVGICGTCAPC